MLLVSACASPPTGTFRQLYDSVNAEGFKSQALTERLEVQAQDRLGPDLEYRISDRLLRSDTTDKFGGRTEREDRTLHAPIAELFLTAGTLLWTQSYRHEVDRRSQSSLPSNTRTRYDIFQELEWLPLQLPQVNAWADISSLKDDRFTDRDQERVVLEVADQRGTLDWLYSLDYWNTTDNRVDSEQESINHLFRATHTDTYLDNRLTTRGTVLAKRDRSELTTPSGSGAIQGQNVTQIGLYAIDNTPSLGALPQNLALTDGIDTVSAGINIGGNASGGGIDRNIGAQLQIDRTVNRITLTTVDEVDPVYRRQYTFSVWSSDDNFLWTLVTGAANYTYQEAFRQYRLNIPRVTARYIKVVNTTNPAAAPAVLISEIAVFEPNTAGSGSTKQDSDSDLGSFTGDLDWQASETLTLSYDLFVQRRLQERDGRNVRDEKRIDNGLSALWAATDRVDVNARYYRRRSDDPKTFDDTFTEYSGLVTYRPLETVDLSVNYTDSEQDQDRDRFTRTRATQARVTAQLLDTLDGEVALDRIVQENADLDITIRRYIASVSLIADLTPRLDVSVTARETLAGTSGSGSNLIEDPDETFVEIIATYRPSDQVTADAELEWQNITVGSGLNQRYRIDWIPFPDGMLDLQADLSRRIDQISDTRVDLLQLLGRLNLSSRTYFDATFTIQWPKDQDRIETLAVVFHKSF